MESNSSPSSSFIYLSSRFWFRIRIFFHHWYVDGSYFLGRQFLNLIMNLERTFALKITATHFFEPLYQDYSIVGQIIGPIFRLGRLLVGGLLYLFFSLIFLAIFVSWLAIPIILLLQTFLTFLSRP